MTNMWIDSFQSSGHLGPDNGSIILESDLENIGRIVFECKREKMTENNYYAVTTVIFDRMVTTAYFKLQKDAEEHIQTIKLIIDIMQWHGKS